MALRGSPEERRAQKAARREENRANWVVKRLNQVKTSGHQRVVVACNAALAVSRRATDEARKSLAAEIAAVAQKYTAPEYRKEQS